MPVHVLRNSGYLSEITAYVDGVATAADGSVTVTARKADGTTLNSGTATHAGSGVYRWQLGAQASLNLITVSWVGTWSGISQTLTSHAEIVGAHIVSEADVRAYAGGVLADTAVYTSAEVAAARAEVTDLLQSHTGISWTPRFRRHRTMGNGLAKIWLPDMYVSAILAATLDGTALTVGDLVIGPDGHSVYRDDGSYWDEPDYDNPVNVALEYEYGHPYHVDNVDRIALMWIKKLLVPSRVDSGASSVSNETGTITYAPFSPSGIREVDAWIEHRKMGMLY